VNFLPTSRTCGDLCFSSSCTYVLLYALTYQKYGFYVFYKRLLWVITFTYGILVIAARQDYSMDVIVAMYTVPLLWYVFDHHYPDFLPEGFTEKNDSLNGSSFSDLPIFTDDSSPNSSINTPQSLRSGIYSVSPNVSFPASSSSSSSSPMRFVPSSRSEMYPLVDRKLRSNNSTPIKMRSNLDQEGNIEHNTRHGNNIGTPLKRRNSVYESIFLHSEDTEQSNINETMSSGDPHGISTTNSLEHVVQVTPDQRGDLSANIPLTIQERNEIPEHPWVSLIRTFYEAIYA